MFGKLWNFWFGGPAFNFGLNGNGYYLILCIVVFFGIGWTYATTAWPNLGEKPTGSKWNWVKFVAFWFAWFYFGPLWILVELIRFTPTFQKAVRNQAINIMNWLLDKLADKNDTAAQSVVAKSLANWLTGSLASMPHAIDEANVAQLFVPIVAEAFRDPEFRVFILSYMRQTADDIERSEPLH